ncbi:MAG: YdcF family protein [Gudongella sp.]|nr:YdcF family protein [Gudongella sp.]
MSEQQLFIIILLTTLFLLGLFFLFFRKNRTSMINGVIFNLFLLMLSFSILVGSVVTESRLLRILMVIVFIIYFLLITFGAFAVIVGSFINSRIVIKRERKSLQNMLTLFLGIGLLVYFIVSNINDEMLSPLVNYLIIYVGVMITFFGFSFYNYLTASFLNSLYKPALDNDYIIVLGSGLINGDKVSRLLGSRIEKAIEFYRLQEKAGKIAKVIFSGGQGENETVSEAYAMANYAFEKGLPKESALLEDKSRTTLENFMYSKKIMDNDKAYQPIFVTSNYHVFRANIYAKMSGLDMYGIGSPTAKYFLPNALIREYIAILSMKKKAYIAIVAAITVIYLLGAAFMEYMQIHIINI